MSTNSTDTTDLDRVREDLTSALPAICSEDDLVKAGVMANRWACQRARSLGNGPTWVKRGQKIRYLRADVVAYMMAARVNSTAEARALAAGLPKDAA